jgi:hypothetical protein
MIVMVTVELSAVRMPPVRAMIMPQAAGGRRQQIGDNRNSGSETRDEHCGW